MTPNYSVLFWFRRDLRLHDQLAMAAALNSGATHLVGVISFPVQIIPLADPGLPLVC
ncbi:deoxyribodipyrimidine photo-lyase [Acidovorax sp.]|uniref:deoxyribodipyrimidine photo-lyase n=1 Tax=Acidovorax sp. TaxID=1872122 RepID=UPI00391F54EC